MSGIAAGGIAAAMAFLASEISGLGLLRDGRTPVTRSGVAVDQSLALVYLMQRLSQGGKMTRRPSIGDFLTNLDQPMPLGEKLVKLVRNLWRRVALRQTCCGHPGEPGC